MKTILLVDDEPGLQQALRFSLEGRGFTCLVATNVTDAVKTLDEFDINLVVTDIMMPGGVDFSELDSQEAGFHFIKIIRSRWPEVGIVCLSVIGDQRKITNLRRQHIRYLRKGETPLSTVVTVIQETARRRLTNR